MEFDPGRCIRIVMMAALIIGAGPVVAPMTGTVQTARADTTTNVITLTSPKNGKQVQGDVTLSATAADSASSIVFYVDGNRYQSSTTGSVSWDASTALPGEHTISAMAYSDSGAILGSDQVSVTVKQPVTISSPPTGSSVSGLVDIKAKGSSGIARANFYVDDDFVATSPPLDYEWDANNAEPGEHEIT
ncbi:MAG: Ig-like domain-containing protein, partial [Candidatus Binataceae bacterium]